MNHESRACIRALCDVGHPEWSSLWAKDLAEAELVPHLLAYIEHLGGDGEAALEAARRHVAEQEAA